MLAGWDPNPVLSAGAKRGSTRCATLDWLRPAALKNVGRLPVRLRTFSLAKLSPQIIGLGCGIIVGTAVIVGQWLFNGYFGFHRVHGIGFVGPIISFAVTAALVST